MVGRNDACPCGSGKKYKKCCEKNEVVSFDHIIDRELFEIQGDILRYTSERYENELEDYIEEHLENYPLPDEAIELLGFYTLTWFTTSLSKNGKTVLDEYLDSNLKNITRSQTKEMVQGWRNNYPSVFRTASVENGKFLMLDDIFTKESIQVKLLDTEDLPDKGDILLGTVLLSEPAMFLGTFFSIPSSNAEEVEQAVLELYSKRGGRNPKGFMKEDFLSVLDCFMSPEIISIDPIEDLEWHSNKHRLVAENFKRMLEELGTPGILAKLGITLWYSFCEAAKPKISNSSIYEAALIYMVTSLTPLPSPLSQKDLAGLYGVSTSSISSKYSEMKKALKKDLEELEEIIASSQVDAPWDDNEWDDDDEWDDDFFFEDEDDDDELYRFLNDDEDEEEDKDDKKKIKDEDLPF